MVVKQLRNDKTVKRLVDYNMRSLIDLRRDLDQFNFGMPLMDTVWAMRLMNPHTSIKIGQNLISIESSLQSDADNGIHLNFIAVVKPDFGSKRIDNRTAIVRLLDQELSGIKLGPDISNKLSMIVLQKDGNNVRESIYDGQRLLGEVGYDELAAARVYRYWSLAKRSVIKNCAFINIIYRYDTDANAARAAQAVDRLLSKVDALED